MDGPVALGMVLAMLVDGNGKPVRGGAGKGQLYASPQSLVVLRPRAAQDLLHRAMLAALVGSVLLVIVNLFTWRSTVALWIAVALQGAYWLTLPARRRALAPEPLSAEQLASERRGGRVLVDVPAKAVVRAVPPEPPRAGFRKPARFELPDGALELYLSEEQFRSAAAALGRDTPGPQPQG